MTDPPEHEHTRAARAVNLALTAVVVNVGGFRYVTLLVVEIASDPVTYQAAGSESQ
jgi:hypothetical protein